MDCMGQGADSASSDHSYSEYESYEEDVGCVDFGRRMTVQMFEVCAAGTSLELG